MGSFLRAEVPLASERTPEMPTEKRDLSDFPTECRPNEANAVEVKFGGPVAILFGHVDHGNTPVSSEENDRDGDSRLG